MELGRVDGSKFHGKSNYKMSRKQKCNGRRKYKGKQNALRKFEMKEGNRLEKINYLGVMQKFQEFFKIGIIN